MAENTYGTYLMKGTTSSGSTTYSKLIDIKDYPDIGGDAETLETTTLSDKMQTFILGIQSGDAMQFTHNYTKADFTALKALEGQELDFAVWFGGTESGGVVTPSGENGKFSFKGQLSVKISGKGVNDVREMVSTIAPTTVITVG